MKLILTDAESAKMEQAAVQLVLQRLMTAAVGARADAIMAEAGDREVGAEELIKQYLEPPRIQTLNLVMPSST
jgi:hypothetical protein